MDLEKALSYIESSFLSSLLKNSNITDISYNGSDIYYLDNLLGRKKSDIHVSETTVKDFVRQLANISEKQFSYLVPKLDVTIGKYRFNVVHSSIGRVGNKEATTFSIRIASEKLLISDDSGFMPSVLCELFSVLLKSKCSIVISGVTGSGKTEFQKYLLSKMEKNTRIVIIDNVLEIDNVRLSNELDVNSWQYDENNDNVSIQDLVKNALRSNPDWLLVAEARGEEMLDVLNSAMTGHPIITTLHAFDNYSVPYRMARMVMMGKKNLSYEDALNDIHYHFRYFVYLKKKQDSDGKIIRYISSIIQSDPSGEANEIYSDDLETKTFKKISKSQINMLELTDCSDEFIYKFVGNGNE